MSITVIPAGSNSGSACINALLKSKIKVRACVRSIEKPYSFPRRDPLVDFIANVDASRKEDLEIGFKDAKSALIVTPHDHKRGFQEDAQLTINMIDAAVEQGVKFIVLVGSWTVNKPVECEGIAKRFLAPEARLIEWEKRGGLQWTVLRGGFFTSNFENMFKPKIKENQTVFCADFTLPTVDTRDIGRCAAVILQQGPEKHHGKTYEMSGPELLSMTHFKAEVEKAIGKPIDMKIVPAASIPYPPSIKGTFMYLEQAKENAVPFTQDIGNLIGKDQCTTVYQYFLERKDQF